MLRRCDFSETNYNGPTGQGRPVATIRSDGSTVSADIQMIAGAVPNMAYTVRLIQTPRPSSAPCWGGDPGVAQGVLVTDAGGAGSLTLRDSIEPGAESAWIVIDRPHPYSQDPAEFYSTDFEVPI